MDKIEKIKELVEQLNQASKAYYNGKQSNLTDKEWDNSFDELKMLENETGFILNSSPTINVGYEVVTKLKKVVHKKPMLSLDKTKDIDKLKSFLGNHIGILSWKEDGLTIVLHYNNGKLIDAVTRGGGTEGSRVLHNARMLKNIPETIDYKNNLIIRGESLISKSDFEEININGEYANPRNLASGSIMQLNNKITKERNLQFKAFGIVECDLDFKLYSEQLEWLKNIGFDTVEYREVNKEIVATAVEDFKGNINTYQFATDGLVLIYDDLEYGERLGVTAHHENNAIALKWMDNAKKTILRDIQWQVGRTGVLTPVAVFDEIELEGTQVSKASLHNVSILKGLELGISDELTVYKCNMIIPQVDENLTKSNTYVLPEKCPVCSGGVEIKSSEQADFMYCTNPECGAKLTQKLKHFCSKKAINIDGLSGKTLEKFIELDFIKDISDVFKLERHKNEIVKLEGFGIKSYNNLKESLEIAKKAKLPNFLFSLGIPQCGLGTCKLICKSFNNDLNAIKGANFDRLVGIDGIGDVTAQSVVEWFKSDNNIKVLDTLLDYVEFEEEKGKEIKQNGVFSGKKIYCTGSFASHKKDELKRIIEDKGGEFSNGYAKSLDYLVVGSLKGSSKTDKALKDGVKVLSEDEFLKMII